LTGKQKPIKTRVGSKLTTSASFDWLLLSCQSVNSLLDLHLEVALEIVSDDLFDSTVGFDTIGEYGVFIVFFLRRDNRNF